MSLVAWDSGHGWTEYHLVQPEGKVRCGYRVPWERATWRCAELTPARWGAVCKRCRELLLRDTGLVR